MGSIASYNEAIFIFLYILIGRIVVYLPTGYGFFINTSELSNVLVCSLIV